MEVLRCFSVTSNKCAYYRSLFSFLLSVRYLRYAGGTPTLIILGVLFNLVAFIAPKRRPKIELYTTPLFALLLALLADVFLDMKYHTYWYFSYEIDWLWLIPLFGGKPVISVLFVNCFPLHRRLLAKVGYIFAWAVVLTVFEWLMVLGLTLSVFDGAFCRASIFYKAFAEKQQVVLI